MQNAVAILFANLKGNLGDLAILEANLVHLSQIYPGYRIDVWTSGFLSTDGDRLQSFIDAGAPPFRLRGKTPDLPMRRWRKVFSSAGLGKALQPFLIASAQREFATEAQSFSQYQRIFIVGGDQFDAIVSAAMFGTLKAIAAINPRLSNFPLSVNPRTQTANAPALLRACLGLIEAPLLVRDEMSHRFLTGAGIACDLGTDSVLSMAARIRSIPASDHATGMVVAITRTAPDDPVHLARLLSALRTLHGPVSTLTTTPSADHVFLDLRDMGVAYSAPGTWQELVAELRSATLVISNRFHCVLLAALVGTPVLAVCNRAKITSVKDAAGLPFWSEGLNATTLDLVQSLLKDGIGQREAFERYLRLAESQKTSPLMAAGSA